MSDPSVPLPVLESIAKVRAFLRSASPSQLGLLFHVLQGISGDALVALATVTSVVSQPEKVSQGNVIESHNGANVRDLWLTPKDAAQRLGRSERWLRRRRSKSPYSGFCIAADSGRGFRVSAKGLDEFMERERRRANE